MKTPKVFGCKVRHFQRNCQTISKLSFPQHYFAALISQIICLFFTSPRNCNILIISFLFIIFIVILR